MGLHILQKYPDLPTEVVNLIKDLKQKEENLRTLINSTPDIVCFKDGEGRWIEANNSIIELFNLKNVEYSSKKDSDLAQFKDPIHKEAYLYCQKTDEIAWQMRSISHGEEEIPLITGGTKIYDVIKVPLFYLDGKRKGLVVLGRDITERVDYQKKLEENEERLHLIAENVDQVFWIYNINNKLTYISPKLEDLMGISIDAAMENNSLFLNYIHPEDKVQFEEKYNQSLQTYDLDAEYRHLHPKKGVRWIWARAFPVYDGHQNLKAVIRISQDITERKKLKEKLIEAQKMDSIGNLSAGVAHDFNNMLGGIMGNASLLHETLENPELKTYTNEILLASKKASSLTQKLLTFGRREKNLKQAVQINKSISEMITILKRSIPPAIQINANLEKTLPTIDADENQISQVLINICLNAIEAIEKNGSVSISTKLLQSNCYSKKNQFNIPIGQYVLVTIEDTGIGMDENTKKHAYEPFFTTKDKSQKKGTGLGLATAYGIMKNHNGYINFLSEVNHGTTFFLHFPVGIRVMDEISQKESLKFNNEGTILYVDDEAMLRNLFKEMGEKLGYTILTANDGVHSLEILQHHNKEITLVVLDLQMPEMNGKEAFYEIQKRYPNLKVALSSGYGKNEELQELVNLGAVGILPKPYDLKSFGKFLNGV